MHVEPTPPAPAPAPAPAAGGSGAGPAPAAPETVSLTAAELADLRAQAAEAAALKAKIGESTAKAKAERERVAKEAEANGELAKALELARAQLAELEGAAPLAEKWRAYEAAETKRLDESASKLPDAFAALYKRAGDVEAKREVLAAYEAVMATAAGAPAAPKTPPTGAVPPSKSPVDFEAAFREGGKAWEDAKARDPEGAKAYSAKISNPASASNVRPLSFASLAGRKA